MFFSISDLLSSNDRILRSICEFYARGKTYDELHAETRADPSKWARFLENTSFKLRVTAYNHRIPQTRAKQVVEDFSYMDLRGRIDMEQPEVTFVCYEECTFRLLFRCTFA